MKIGFIGLGIMGESMSWNIVKKHDDTVYVFDYVKEKTELLCLGENAKEVARSAFQLPEDVQDIKLKGLVSRKKQLIPSIVTVLQQ